MILFLLQFEVLLFYKERDAIFHANQKRIVDELKAFEDIIRYHVQAESRPKEENPFSKNFFFFFTCHH